MSNKEFYEKLLQYEDNGQIKFLPKVLENDYLRLQVGKKVMAIHLSAVEFARDIKSKERNHQFFTQATLESYLDRTHPFIERAVREGEYVRIVRGKSAKFYIKKDWEEK